MSVEDRHVLGLDVDRDDAILLLSVPRECDVSPLDVPDALDLAISVYRRPSRSPVVVVEDTRTEPTDPPLLLCVNGGGETEHRIGHRLSQPRAQTADTPPRSERLVDLNWRATR